jgi:hypothetical protein
MVRKIEITWEMKIGREEERGGDGDNEVMEIER